MAALFQVEAISSVPSAKCFLLIGNRYSFKVFFLHLISEFFFFTCYLLNYVYFLMLSFLL